MNEERWDEKWNKITKEIQEELDESAKKNLLKKLTDIYNKVPLYHFINKYRVYKQLNRIKNITPSEAHYLGRVIKTRYFSELEKQEDK